MLDQNKASSHQHDEAETDSLDEFSDQVSDLRSSYISVDSSLNIPEASSDRQSNQSSPVSISKYSLPSSSPSLSSLRNSVSSLVTDDTVKQKIYKGKTPASTRRVRPGYKRTSSLSGVLERTHALVRGSASSVSQLFRRDSSTSVASLYNKDCTHEEASEILTKYLEEIKHKDLKIQRTPMGQSSFKSVYWFIGCLFIYLVLIGVPIWKGVLWWLYFYMVNVAALGAGWAIFMGLAIFYAYMPLIFTQFHKKIDPVEIRDVSETALIIPAYKAEAALPETIECALEIFPASHIFVVANGNSPTPLDNTAKVCEKYHVHHTWVPIGSKITAEYAGCAVARKFKYILLIDDDVHLPKNFPVKTDMMVGKTKCVGYTIKSVGAGGSVGSNVQQCQDMEYKLAGLTRQFSGNWGSATFPHGAIILWDREALSSLFKYHPGFLISEDWFFGDVARRRGMRIAFCSQVFVETETPTDLFKAAESRGGYGEMTVWKQRFYRWNYFFVTRTAWNLHYIFFSWKLGFREIVCKIYVFQEFYETLLYLTGPFVFPLTVYLQPMRFGIFTAATILLYFLGILTFNYIHLRRINQSIKFKAMLIFFPYKFCLVYVNLTSIWYSLWHQAKFWAKRHPRVTKNPAALAAVAQLQDDITPGEFLEMLIGKEKKRKRNEEKFELLVQQVREEDSLKPRKSQKFSFVGGRRWPKVQPLTSSVAFGELKRPKLLRGFSEMSILPSKSLTDITKLEESYNFPEKSIDMQKWKPPIFQFGGICPYDDTDAESFLSTSMPLDNGPDDTASQSPDRHDIEDIPKDDTDVSTDDQTLTGTSLEEDNTEPFVTKGIIGNAVENIRKLPLPLLTQRIPTPDLEAALPERASLDLRRPSIPPRTSSCTSISSVASCPNLTQGSFPSTSPLIKGLFTSRMKKSGDHHIKIPEPSFAYKNIKYAMQSYETPVNTFDMYAPSPANFQHTFRLPERSANTETTEISGSVEDSKDYMS